MDFTIEMALVDYIPVLLFTIAAFILMGDLKNKMSRALSDFEFKITSMYVDGMTCAEICEATGKDMKSVDNAIQRSKRKLQQILKK
mgnify:CR=1 FL=1